MSAESKGGFEARSTQRMLWWKQAPRSPDLHCFAASAHGRYSTWVTSGELRYWVPFAPLFPQVGSSAAADSRLISKFAPSAAVEDCIAAMARRKNASKGGAGENWQVTEVSCKTSSVTSVSKDGERKAKRIWTRLKEQYQLVEFQALPDYLRDNEYILNYYRADWPLKHTLLSIFSVHNETLNIWTHLVGFLFFLALTVYTAMNLPTVANSPSGWERIPSLSSVPDFHKLQEGFRSSLSYFMPDNTVASCSPPNSSSSEHCILEAVKGDVAKTVSPLLNAPARWPFFVFLFGAMTCLLTSSTCHLLACHSRRLSSVMWRMDYAGIAVMIATSFYPPIYYVFQCEPLWRQVYLSGITLLALGAVCVTIIPCLHSRRYRIFRTTMFVGMGLSGVIPGGHALVENWHEPMCFTVLGYELAMVFFYLFGTFIYAARIPERWKPGKFDIAGHSHQIFHVMVIAGAYAHYQAAVTFLEWRNAKACNC